MDILIAGDLVPTYSNIELFNNSEMNALLGTELLSLWNSVDIRMFNLEVPLTDDEAPIDKCGPNLIAPKSTVNGIKALNPSLITLANNHILDQGQSGMKSTKDTLNKHDIPFIGIGNNLLDASQPYIIQKNGLNIGIYACAEHEFSIATDNTPGANPFDPLESLDHIQALKDKCDYVIILYHGGKEHYRYPSPNLQKICRKIVQKGADLIICQHSHCVGSFEEYEGSTIVYGQGNFIFNKHDNEFWNNSLLIKVSIVVDNLQIEYIPIVRKGNSIRLAAEAAVEEIMSGFYSRSKEILDDGFIERNYEKFAAKNIKSHLVKLSGFGKWMSIIDRRLLNNFLLKRKYTPEKLLAIQNYIECEAHRELLLNGLKHKKHEDI